jgi:hypothetical protein
MDGMYPVVQNGEVIVIPKGFPIIGSNGLIVTENGQPVIVYHILDQSHNLVRD